jgi:hypothetical protein
MSPSALAIVLSLALGGGTLEQKTVTKSSVYLVKEPSFLAAPASKPILRGEKVDVFVPHDRGWFSARYHTASGYIHLSYVSDRAIAFKAKANELASDSSVSGSYNLATPGFTEDLEKRYRHDHPNAEKGYRLLEPFAPTKPGAGQSVPSDPEGEATFVKDGNLHPWLTPPAPPTGSAK